MLPTQAVQSENIKDNDLVTSELLFILWNLDFVETKLSPLKRKKKESIKAALEGW